MLDPDQIVHAGIRHRFGRADAADGQFGCQCIGHAVQLHQTVFDLGCFRASQLLLQQIVAGTVLQLVGGNTIQTFNGNQLFQTAISQVLQ